MRVLRVLGYLLTGLLLLLVGAAAFGFMRFQSHLATKHSPPGFIVHTNDDPETLARGEHIARTIGGCAECHGNDYGGTIMAQEAIFTMAPPNITRGKGGVVEGYKPDDWMRAIAYGVHRDGRTLIAMPSEELGKIADADLSAVVSFLMQVPPVDRTVPPTKASFLGAVLFGLTGAPVYAAELAANRKAPDEVPDVDDTKAYGKYLVAVCQGCHGVDFKGGIATHPGAPMSSDISPSAMATWTFADLERALREGIKHDGKPMNPADMPWGMTKNFTATEMKAVWKALRDEP